MRTVRRPAFRFERVQHLRSEHVRPLRDLMVRLPEVHTDALGNPDYLRSSPSLLLEIAEYAEQASWAISLGIAAIGNIVPFAAPEIEDGTVPMASVEALGWLLSELGAVPAACGVLAAECRRAGRSGSL
jgi:hypothetical protein